MKVVIDPGHGGEDNGAAYGEKLDYLEEDDTNLIIAFLLRFFLLSRKIDVRLTREKDVFVSLADRAKLANDWDADLFISLHADAFHRESASGMSVHIHPEASKGSVLIAEKVDTIFRWIWTNHTQRGVRRNNFQVLRDTQMPAVLIEAEFVSNPATRRFLKEPKNQLDLAIQIGNAICGYRSDLCL